MDRRHKTVFYSLLLLLALGGSSCGYTESAALASRGSHAQVFGPSSLPAQTLHAKADGDDTPELRSVSSARSPQAETAAARFCFFSIQESLAATCSPRDKSYDKHKLETLSARAHPPTL